MYIIDSMQNNTVSRKPLVIQCDTNAGTDTGQRKHANRHLYEFSLQSQQKFYKNGFTQYTGQGQLVIHGGAGSGGGKGVKVLL